MIQIDDIILTDDIKDVHFVCDLTACRGACCVEGDFGAPLDEDEIDVLEKIYPEVAPYLSERSQKSIEEQGTWIQEPTGEKSTPLIEGQECVYTVFKEGTAFCGIEEAFLDGKIKYQKPISCHLYPLRAHQFTKVKIESLNYDKWSVCKDACSLGKKLQVPLYRFLKAPLIRKYGEVWYEKLVLAIETEG